MEEGIIDDTELIILTTPSAEDIAVDSLHSVVISNSSVTVVVTLKSWWP